MKNIGRLVALAWMCSVVFMGCGGPDSPDPGTRAQAGVRVGTCQRDPALIDRRSACVTDDHCPCGTHCARGECIDSCRSSDECDGDGAICDDFGRCRAESAASLLPAPSTANSARILPTDVLSSGRAGEDQTIEFTVEGDAPEPVRVRGTGGATVQCQHGQSFVEECVIEAMPGESLSVVVRPDADSARAGSIEVHTANDTETISIQVFEHTEPAPTEVAGSYHGSLRQSAAGVGGAGEVLPEPYRRLTVPISARIWADGDAYLFEIIDDAGVLSPTGRVIGTFELDDENAGAAQIPAYTYFEGQAPAGDQARAIAVTESATVAATGNPATVRLHLDQRLEGVIAGDEDLRMKWSLVLQRNGAVEDSAPEVPADEALDVDVDQARAEPLAIEAAFREAVRPAGGIASEDIDSVVDTYLRRGDAGYLDACVIGDETRAKVGAQIRDAAYFGDSDEIALSDDPASLLLARMAEKVRNAVIAEAQANTTVTYTGSDDQSDSSQIPCEFAVGLVDARRDGTCADVRTMDASFGDIDLCQQLADQTGCTVVDGGRDFAFTIDAQVQTDACSGTLTATGDALVARSCVLPSRPATCGELVACVEPPANTSRNRLRVGFASTSIDGAGGDLGCSASARTTGVEVDALATDPESALNLWESYEACRTDLENLAKLQLTAESGGGARLAEVFDTAGCVDTVRLLASVLEGLADSGAASTANQMRFGLAQRLLARLMQAHAFVLHQASEAEATAEIFRREPTSEFPAPDELDRFSKLTEPLYNLLLHPRVATALVHLPDAYLADPDYRRALGAAGQPREPEIPIHVVLLETLSADLDYLQTLMARARRDADEQAAGELRDRYSRIVALYAIATELDARATSVDDSPRWASRARQAGIGVAQGVERNRQLIEEIRQGANPLGIEDADLPLYLFQDAEGVSARFSAISDFLIGPGPGATAWAPTLVTELEAQEQLVRDRYSTLQTRKYRQQVNSSDATIRLEASIADTEGTLQEYCGPSTANYFDDPKFAASSCYVRDDAGCGIGDPAAYFGQMSAADMRLQLCVGNTLSGLTDGEAGFVDTAMAELANRQCASLEIASTECPDGAAVCLNCDGDRVALDLNRLSMVAPSSPPPGEGADAEFSSDSRYSGVMRQAVERCRQRHPDGSLELPALDTDEAACLKGSIGEAALAVVAAEQDLAIARSEYNDHYRAFDITMENCTGLVSDVQEKTRLTEAHLQNMEVLGGAKLGMDISATMAGATKDCIATLAGSQSGNPIGNISGSVLSVGACAAGAVEAGFETASLSIGTAMEHAERNFEATIGSIEDAGAVRECMAGAEMELVGASTAAKRIQRTMTDLAAANNEVRDLREHADNAWRVGHATAARLEDLTVTPPDVATFIESEIREYQRRFALAQRATYLAVRAVEYEYQATLPLRGQVIAAKTAADLRTVLTELWNTAGTRAIGGNRPGDFKAVVSMRDHLLQLVDETQLPAGYQQLTADDRFRLALQSPQFAHFDASGEYRGQRIPFEIAPLGQIGLGDAASVPVLVGNDCAERIWSVNASILGDDVVGDAESTFSRLELHKSNTFYSQWCDSANSGVQNASVRPSRNLFRDPAYGAASGVGSQLGPQNEARGFTSARMEAFFNVSRADLEADDYANGDSTELAGRGLYGSYALFIPAEIISKDGQNGLVLEQVDDILLRIEYLSVARQ